MWDKNDIKLQWEVKNGRYGSVQHDFAFTHGNTVCILSLIHNTSSLHQIVVHCVLYWQRIDLVLTGATFSKWLYQMETIEMNSMWNAKSKSTYFTVPVALVNVIKVFTFKVFVCFYFEPSRQLQQRFGPWSRVGQKRNTWFVKPVVAVLVRVEKGPNRDKFLSVGDRLTPFKLASSLTTCRKNTQER